MLIICHIIYLHKNEINEHFKQSKSMLFISQLASSNLTFKKSIFRHHTSFMLMMPLVTHNPHSTTTILVF